MTAPTARPIAETMHGTLTGYTYGCRCRPCRDARRDYARDRRHAGLDQRHAGPEISAAVLDVLIADADLDGVAVTSQPRIAQITGYSRHAVGYAIHQMADDGRISLLGRHDSKGAVLMVQLQEADL